jgi:hypothetical protein
VSRDSASTYPNAYPLSAWKVEYVLRLQYVGRRQYEAEEAACNGTMGHTEHFGLADILGFIIDISKLWYHH